MMNITLFVLISVLIQNLANCESDVKSSLTFVIDDTGSMSDDIEQVITEANNIFDTVMNSDSSQIEDFVLVTFNDPDVTFRTATKNRERFKTQLESIRVDGGDDCPEYSMSGIEEALHKSRSGSYLYVFTDAASKDYQKYETVSQLAKEKGCQIVFILTGICNPGEGNSDVYNSLADDTLGQVFNLYKNEVHKILNYVKEQVKSRKTVIVSKKFPAGTHIFDYTVDGNMKELVVSVSGENPHTRIFDPDGIEAETEGLVNTARVAIVKVTEVKPGVYKAEVKSDTEMTVVVSGTNTMHFQHGFSVDEPDYIEETATRPFPDKKSYLSIKLTEGMVELNLVQILDLNHNIIEEIPLDLVNIKDQFYVTTKAFLPPNDSFKIAVKGFDVASKTMITRFGLIPIEPQDIMKEVAVGKAPTVSIIGTSEVTVPYEEPVQLKCKVSAFPKPTIVWENRDGLSISSIVTQIEVPYDYVSYIEIESVNNNNTYTCRASNDHGTDSKEVNVKTKRTRYFDVVERPNDAVIELNKDGRFVCQVDAAPPATIQWYKGRKELKKSAFYEISPGASVLNIKEMKPHMVGKYSCKVKNDYHRKLFTFFVKTSGEVQPKIDKTIKERRVREGEDVELSCRIIQGAPKPALKWDVKLKAHSMKKIKASETVVLRKVTRDDTGTFRCLAYNDVGEDLHYIDLIVEYPPNISDIPKSIKVIAGETVHLPCAVEGMPVPAVKWFLNNYEVKNSKQYWIHSDFSISFKATLNTTGNFTCVAVNTYGFDKISTIVNVSIPATIEIPEESVREVAVGSDVSLDCRSHGYPEPSVRWIFFSSKHNKTQKLRPDSRGSLKLSRIQVTQQGYYTCVARNAGGMTNITYDIKVLSPPYIIREPDLKLTAVSGDLVFRIPCKTLGNPDPVILWMTKGFLLSKGTDWFDYDSDGTLIVKNVDKESEGYYTCEATNSMGKAEETVYLEVKEYPEPQNTKNTLVIAEGNSSKVKCEVPHKRIDTLRWYKDGKQISTGELNLVKVKPTDSGLYICRVSTLHSSKSGFIDVRIGYKPRFLYTDHLEKNTHIEFRDGKIAVMDCSVSGEPAPKVTWWYDGHKLKETGMKNTLRMTLAKRGTYFCLARNIFGYVVRSFEISTQECKLNIQRELTGNQPLILSLDWKLPSFENIEGSVRIPLHERLVMSCPAGFVKFPRRTELYATCDKGTNFIVDDTYHEFSDLKCKEEIQPKIERINKRCLSEDSELIKIGYEIRGTILEVYEVCFSMKQNLPLFVKQEIKSMSDTILSNPKWYDNELSPFNFDQMYDSNYQIDYISSVLGKWFHLDDDCRFSKRQLVDPRSVSPGLSQVAAYSHLNVVPHWSTCNEMNWKSVENRVRKLAKILKRPLQVWTGITQQLQLEGAYKREYLFLSDEKGQRQPIPRYIWKVVQDPLTLKSLTIIQVNIPDFSESDIDRYTLCRDICSKVAWMKSKTWRNVDTGYTYCCNTKEFESAFGYNGLFNSSNVLFKAE